MTTRSAALSCAAIALCASLSAAQNPAPSAPPPAREPLNRAPARRSDEGRGPFKTLVMRGAILIDGTGAPPVGPVDIVVEQNRIAAVRSAGTPGLPLRPSGRRRTPSTRSTPPACTCCRDSSACTSTRAARRRTPTANIRTSCGWRTASRPSSACRSPSTQLTVSERERSNRNEIVAPRLVNYQRPGSGWQKGAVDTPDAAREWVRGPRPTVSTA